MSLLHKHIHEALSQKKDHNTILIVLGSKQNNFIFNKELNNKTYDRIYNKLLSFQYQNNNIIKYKHINKEFSIINRQNKIIENRSVDYNIHNEYIINLVNQKNISLLEFPCKQFYHSIEKYQQVKFTINENLEIFVNENNKNISIKIKINSYIYDTINKISNIIN